MADGLDLKSGWFSEVSDRWPGFAIALEVKEVLLHERSEYQDVLVYDSTSFGRVLVLDGVIQLAIRDEYFYHEMISHLPMFAHPCPKSVLVVGGGDGGVLRELAKHPMVEEIHLCEIDEKVIQVCKQYFPSVAVGFDNPKVKVHIQDGVEFMGQQKEVFDVVITDSPSPDGPAIALYETAYFKKVKEALKPGGIMCMQGECLFLDLDIIRGFVRDLKQVFSRIRYSHINPPSAGMIGFLLAGKDPGTNVDVPARTLTDKEASDWNLRYYDSNVHGASFVLPRFAKIGLGLEE